MARVVVVALAALAVAAAIGANAALLWPLPRSYAQGGDTELALTRSRFAFVATGADSDVLQEAFARTLVLLFPSADADSTAAATAARYRVDLTQLLVQVNSTDLALRSGVNESYTLTVDAAGTASLQAPTVWGALHGLETFVQLTDPAGTDAAILAGAPVAIQDEPRFQHRGLLVDSSRNFLSVAALQRTIDGLAATKMNVLHWHIVDSQSFPFQVPELPFMTAGAYSAAEIYTPADINTLVSYAYMRGVRIMPEFDSPGHAYAWGVGYPGITVCPDLRPYARYCRLPPCGQLNPSSEQTYDVVRAVMAHAASVFPDDLLHLGFDEVSEGCWESSEELQAWMVEQGIPDSRGLLQYHLDRLMDLIGTSRRPVMWQEAFDEGLELPANAILQIWNRPESLSAILRAGFNAVSSPFNSWYLDCGSGSPLPGGDRSWCPFNSWRSVYMYEPVPEDLADDPTAAARLHGGEVCLWGEMVDSLSIDGLAWPRAAAAGERLWSSADVRDPAEAVFRFERHRDRLASRGIRARIIRPKYCNLHPGSCEMFLED